MAYFNHAFSKMFVGTHPTEAEAYVGGAGTALTQAGIDKGFVTSRYKVSGGPTRLTSADLQSYGMGPGCFAFFNKDNYQIVQNADLAGQNCCPLVLASASIRLNDKIGPFHGGYQESTKSKIINPKYIHKFYKVESCVPQQSVVSVGYTPYVPTQTNAACCFEFLCGETYYLRIDVKGSPALRALNHNAYQTIDAYTGCCPGATPTPVDPALVYISWADKITVNNYLKSFILPVVFDYAQLPWYAPGTTVDPLSGAPIGTHPKAGGGTVPATWDYYTQSASAAAWTNECTAGMRLFGAFVETKFGNCSFQITDFFEKEPVRIYGSLVDYNGDPCTFEGLCVLHECDGLQGMGFGEQVIRDLILSESYLQNFFHKDIRIREITEGDSVFNVISRNALYTRYYLLHSVPRFNNPTGIFDTDQYLLEVVTTAASASFETFMGTWLGACTDCVSMETEACTPCTIVANS